MSAREEHIYKQLAATDARKSAALRQAAKEAGKDIPATIKTEPLETAFFLPTKQDIATARKWQRRLGNRPDHEMRSLFTAVRLIAQGTAVPLSSLELLRQFDRDRQAHANAEADTADRRYVEEDARRLADLDPEQV